MPPHERMYDAIAEQQDFDVFNAFNVRNESFLKELKFGIGDGQGFQLLHHLWQQVQSELSRAWVASPRASTEPVTLCGSEVR